MLGIIWRIGDIAKNCENISVFNDLSRFGGSKLSSFSYVFGVSVSRSCFDRLGVGFGFDFGAVWAPKWGLCWGGLGGLVWGRFWDGFWGVWDPSKIPSSPKSRGDLRGLGALRQQNRLLIFERRSLNEGQ